MSADLSMEQTMSSRKIPKETWCKATTDLCLGREAPAKTRITSAPFSQYKEAHADDIPDITAMSQDRVTAMIYF